MAEHDGTFDHLTQIGPYTWRCRTCGETVPDIDVEMHEAREDAISAAAHFIEGDAGTVELILSTLPPKWRDDVAAMVDYLGRL